MMTSEQTNEWNVPVMNLRMKKSSVTVWASRMGTVVRRFAKMKNKIVENILDSCITYKHSTSSKPFYAQSDAVDLPSRKSEGDLFSA